MSITSCTQEKLRVKVFETSKSGNKLTEITSFNSLKNASSITINTEKTYQKITGFGGSFTEASAHLLNNLSAKNRRSILNAYFSKEGANYSLTRTHMNSCDFSLSNYSYTPKGMKQNDVAKQLQQNLTTTKSQIQRARKLIAQGFMDCCGFVLNEQGHLIGELQEKENCKVCN